MDSSCSSHPGDSPKQPLVNDYVIPESSLGVAEPMTYKRHSVVWHIPRISIIEPNYLNPGGEPEPEFRKLENLLHRLSAPGRFEALEKFLTRFDFPSGHPKFAHLVSMGEYAHPYA